MWRAYQLKEALRAIFDPDLTPGEAARCWTDSWLYATLRGSTLLWFRGGLILPCDAAAVQQQSQPVVA